MRATETKQPALMMMMIARDDPVMARLQARGFKDSSGRTILDIAEDGGDPWVSIVVSTFLLPSATLFQEPLSALDTVGLRLPKPYWTGKQMLVFI